MEKNGGRKVRSFHIECQNVIFESLKICYDGPFEPFGKVYQLAQIQSLVIVFRSVKGAIIGPVYQYQSLC